MASMGIGKITVEVQSVTKYCFVFFPIATYKKIGDISVITVFGLPVYRRAGGLKKIFFYTTGGNRD